MATQETPIHQQVAEKIVAGLKKATRDKITVTPKSSYSIVSTEDGWFARVTPKIAEFSKKRITEEGLEKLGLHGDGARPMHRSHHVGALLAIADMDDGEAKLARESELSGVGVEEMIAAFEAAVKPSQRTRKGALGPRSGKPSGGSD